MVTRMRKSLASIALLLAALLTISTASALLDEFTQDELDDNWVADRQYPSGGVESVSFAGRDNVAKIGVVAALQDSDPFRQFEGIKKVGDFGTEVQVDLYVPSEWQTADVVNVGFWASDDPITAYPIIVYRNSATVDAGFYVWDGVAEYVYTGLPVNYDDWNTLAISLDGGVANYFINGDAAGGIAATSANFGQVFLNHYNDGLRDYDAYWHVGGEEIVLSAEITSPSEGELVSTTLDLAATYTGDPADPLFWAVRADTCDTVASAIVLGNVDGFDDPYTWEDGEFSASFDVSGFDTGSYCFAFNPDGNNNDVRETVEFVIDSTPPLVTIESPLDGAFVAGVVDIFGTIDEDYAMGNHNVAIYDGDADFMDFSLRLEQANVNPSSIFSNELIYSWDTTAYADGAYLVRFAARDLAGNRDLSVDPFTGGVDSQHVITLFVDNDGDGIAEGDMCPGTVPDEPSEGLGVNRHIWNGEEFVTLVPAGRGQFEEVSSGFSMEDTMGCSCAQILDDLGGNNEGHHKFGCSKGLIESWIAG